MCITKRKKLCWSPTSTKGIMHENVKVTKGQRKKSQVHTMCDHTKGGVDLVDLLSTSHSTRMKTKRWALNALAFMPKMQRPSLRTTAFSSATSNSRTTLAKLWYSLQLNDDTATQMDYKSELSTRCGVFLVSRKVSRKPGVDNA